ncbi:hypothetical protein AAE478_008659 [Parahypoxylon ruwenzoriense]
MGCDCTRITFRYRCGHKQRDVYKCWRYVFKHDNLCLGALLPSCRPVRISTDVGHRVCSQCHEYFAKRFGRDAAPWVTQKFLEYKDRWWQRKAIDPTTVPYGAYITSAELAQLGVRTAATVTNQPFRPRSPMTVVTPWSAPVTQLRPPPPIAQRGRIREHHGLQSKPQVKPPGPSSRPPNRIPRKPLPRSHAGGSKKAAAVPEPVYQPVVEYGTGEEINLTDLVSDAELEDDFEYNPIYRGRPLTRSPQQPTARHPKKTPKDPRQQQSGSSLVNRITEVAETIEIAGYPNPESRNFPSVPKISVAPRVPSWRSDTPHPAAGVGSGSGGGIYRQIRYPSRTSTPFSHRAGVPALHSAPMRYVTVRTAPSVSSLTGIVEQVRTLSADDISIPPLRTPAPGSGIQRFRERGVPSALHLAEGNTSRHGETQQALSPTSGTLVTISTPSPSYSCAVQSCYCSPTDKDNKVCPSCRERRRLERELQMQWI